MGRRVEGSTPRRMTLNLDQRRGEVNWQSWLRQKSLMQRTKLAWATFSRRW